MLLVHGSLFDCNSGSLNWIYCPVDFELKFNSLDPMYPLKKFNFQWRILEFGTIKCIFSISHTQDQSMSVFANMFALCFACPFERISGFGIIFCSSLSSIFVVDILFWHVDNIFSIMMLMCLLVLFTEQVACCCSFWCRPSLEARCWILVGCYGFCPKFCALYYAKTDTKSGTTCFCYKIWSRDAVVTCTIHLLCCCVFYSI